MNIAQRIAQRQLAAFHNENTVLPLFRGAALALQSCDNFEVIISGPSECIAGETLIYDPITQIETPIEVLATNGVPITVLTQYGPQTIDAPFRKGYAALYRVICDNGQSFVATAKHKVLTIHGWLYVCDLVSGYTSLYSPQMSIAVSYPQVFQQDALHLNYTASNYLDHYSTYHRQCDVLLQRVLNSVVDVAPSLNDAHVHNCDCYQMGDRIPLQAYNRLCQSSIRLASEHCQHQPVSAACTGYCFHEYMQKHAAQESRVSSVTFERYDAFYDMTVPNAGHYYAQGFWHHNTGKSFAALWFVHSFLRRYRGAQGLITRATQKSIYLSILKTYQAIIRDDKTVVPYGGLKPEWYTYANGSQLYIAGLDNDDKILSTEFDIVYVNQAEGISAASWETLTTRVTGRASNAPVSYIIGDCNPAGAGHWIIHRPTVKLLQSEHRDNPKLYTDDGQLTVQGERSLSILSNLTGVRKQRLFLGQWVSAEGAIYPEFNTQVHVIPSFVIPQDWPRYRVIDFGFTNPFTCLWAAIDHDGRAYFYRELYCTGQIVGDLAPVIVSFSTGENIVATIADHDAEDRATLARHGIDTIPARKAVRLGIEAVQLRFRSTGDGKPRIYFFNDALVDNDELVAQGLLVEVSPTLEDRHLPTCTIEEIDGYVWDSKKEQPVKTNDHGCDSMRYLVAEIDDIGRELETMISVYVDDQSVMISPY